MKGDQGKLRDKKKYRDNYDLIFNKKPKDSPVRISRPDKKHYI